MHIITVLRHYMGYSQASLAKLANISCADLSEMETRKPYGSITKYKKLADALGVDVHILVTNDFLRLSEGFFDMHQPQPYSSPINLKQTILGREGEDEAFHIETSKVSKFHPSLSKLVLPYYKMKHTPGYDILSYNTDGKPIYIEVKTTETYDATDFQLTKHEFKTASACAKNGETYYIYLFTGWGTKKQQLHILNFSNLVDENRLSPVKYTCDLRPRPKTINGILYYRKLHGYSQLQISEILDIPTSCLCKYESGENTCPVNIYQKLADFYKVTIDQLLDIYQNCHST